MRHSLALFLILGAACGGHSPAPAKPAPEPDLAADKSAVHTIVQSHHKDVSDCYEKKLLENPQLTSGRLTVSFSIGDHGTVTAATATGAFDPEVDACVLAQIKTWQFPNLQSKQLDISYPFDFKAQTE